MGKRIAGVVGWGKTMGCIASNISVGVVEPGHVHRGGVKGGAAHTVYRTGEVHGNITERAHEVCRLVAHADSGKVTDNLWGERWSKLVANTMANERCVGLHRAPRLPDCTERAHPPFPGAPRQRGDRPRPRPRLPAP